MSARRRVRLTVHVRRQTLVMWGFSSRFFTVALNFCCDILNLAKREHEIQKYAGTVLYTKRFRHIKYLKHPKIKGNRKSRA